MAYITIKTYNPFNPLGDQTRIGRVDYGRIYDATDSYVGSYDESTGTIYDADKYSVGTVENGTVYRHRIIIGEYKYDEIYYGCGLYKTTVAYCNDVNLLPYAAGAALLLLDAKSKSEYGQSHYITTSDFKYDEEDNDSSDDFSSSDYSYDNGSSGGSGGYYSGGSEYSGKLIVIILSLLVFGALYYFITKDSSKSPSSISYSSSSSSSSSSSCTSLDYSSRYISSTNTDGAYNGIKNKDEDVCVGTFKDTSGHSHKNALKFWLVDKANWSNTESITIDVSDISKLSGESVLGELKTGRCEAGASAVAKFYLDGSLVYITDRIEGSYSEPFILDVSSGERLTIEVSTSANVFTECLVDISSIQ